MTNEQSELEASLARLERLADDADASDSNDPMVARIREHVRPYVEVMRGRRELPPGELAAHSAAVSEILREAGDAVSTILTRVSDIITEGTQRSRRSQFGGDDLEGKA
jgi:hypothetical protein